MKKHEKHFRRAYEGFLKAGGTVERALEIIATISELPGDGQRYTAQNGQVSGAESGQPVEGKGQKSVAEKAIVMVPDPSNLSRGSGHPMRARNGHGNGATPRAPTKAALAAQRDAKAAAAQSIMDTFKITERQGSRISIGDVPVSSYERVLARLNKRAFVSTRERNLLWLLIRHRDSQAFVPPGAKTRDIVSAKEMKATIAKAAELELKGEGLLPVPKVLAKELA